MKQFAQNKKKKGKSTAWSKKFWWGKKHSQHDPFPAWSQIQALFDMEQNVSISGAAWVRNKGHKEKKN